MSLLHLKYFTLLKQNISEKFSENNAAPLNIEDWKGETITTFQEDVFVKTKTSVSEKWFYTYFKNDVKKLPRIDMLNILCKYIGYKNWGDFIANNKVEGTGVTSKKKNKAALFLIFLLTALTLIIYFFTIKSYNHFEFCFVDEDRNTAITKTPLNITVLQENESPIHIKTDSLGCFSYKTKDQNIEFIVDSPYHKTDTIYRSIEKNENRIVKLKTDDYALMLHFYSNGNKSDWVKRKNQLSHLFDEKVIIYRIFKNNIGVELYSKDDFINQLTIPTSTLKNIEILDKVYKHDKIVKLKFMVK